MQSCLREICFVAAINEFQIRGNSISGVDNRLADYLSRWNQNDSLRNMFYKEAGNCNIIHDFVPEVYLSFPMAGKWIRHQHVAFEFNFN